MFTLCRPTFGYLVVSSVLLTGTCQQVVSQESRRWYSADQQQFVDATFVEYDRTTKTVTLQTDSGQQLAVGLSQLSNIDRRYALLQAKNQKTNSQQQGASVELPQLQPLIAERGTHKAGSDQKSVTRDLFGIRWTNDIENALQVACGKVGTQDDKPVMWLRVLGDLDGFM